jgi:hypothetical protein
MPAVAENASGVCPAKLDRPSVRKSIRVASYCVKHAAAERRVDVSDSRRSGTDIMYAC